MKKKLAIMVIGPPGSGKGTQGKMLAKDFGFSYIEMGPTLARFATDNKEIGPEIKKMMKEGELVPDEWVIRALNGKFSAEISVVLDGVPRRIGQAKGVIKLADKYNLELVAIYIKLSDEEVIKRLTSRKMCPKCGYSPPHPEVLGKTYCDKCGTKLERRLDDKEEVIKERLVEYHKKTEPMVKFLKDKGVQFLEFDGRPKIPEIYRKVKASIQKIIKGDG